MSDNFTEAELTFSDTAVRLGIDNTPSDEIRNNLADLADGLERVRKILGHPMHINSGYRCLKLNAAVRGAVDSAHTKGYAADFTCREFGEPDYICRVLDASGLQFDQLISEGKGEVKWVHISFDPRMRRITLTGTVHADGSATYTNGTPPA